MEDNFMKKNKVLKTPIIMIFVVIVIVILAIIGANNKYINSTKSLCNNINKYKKGNKSFVVYFEPQNSDTNEEIKSPINQLSEDYKKSWKLLVHIVGCKKMKHL